MKVIYVGINAKYIHTNPAIRILTKLSRPYFESDFVEFTIKDDNDQIIKELVATNATMIGFSCYIWNIEKAKDIVKKIKQQKPGIICFAGGPEVTYDTEVYPFDYVLKGDAECVIVDFLLNRTVLDEPVYVTNMQQVPTIYDMYESDDFHHRIIYMETSRGCPFRCSYCLASVQLNHVIFKPESMVNEELQYYVEHQAQTIKFLDRSFNVNPQRFLRLLASLNSLKTAQVFQFEIAADLLNKPVMDYLLHTIEPGRVRLEIGIQSVHAHVNDAVDRNTDVAAILNKIEQLVLARRVIIHADLIVGLPFETLDLAMESLDRVFKVYPHELQLGFLKMLKGTKLARQADAFGYDYASQPPYQVISNPWMSVSDMKSMKAIEIGLEALWNKKRLLTTIRRLVGDLGIHSSRFFHAIGEVLLSQKTTQEAAFYEVAYQWAKQNDVPVLDCIKFDYLQKNQIRPKRFWGYEAFDVTKIKKTLLESRILDQTRLSNAFVTQIEDGYLVLVYRPDRQLFCIKNGLLVEMS